MKNFQGLDVTSWLSSIDGTRMLRLSAEYEDLIEAPMWYHDKGLRETISGYGRKLNSGYKISFQGKLYRVYTTIFSNSGTNWFTANGHRIIVG